MPALSDCVGVSDGGGMDDFDDAVMQALRELSTRPAVKLEISPLLAFFLLSQLQLAFRHPLNTGKSQAEVRGFFDGLRSGVAPVGGVLDRVIEMGFDEQFDRPQAKAE